MAVKIYENGAWRDASFIKRHDESSWKDINYAKRYENNEWKISYPEERVKIGDTINDYVDEFLHGDRPLGSTYGTTALIGHLVTIPSPGVYTFNKSIFSFNRFTGALYVSFNSD